MFKKTTESESTKNKWFVFVQLVVYLSSQRDNDLLQLKVLLLWFHSVIFIIVINIRLLVIWIIHTMYLKHAVNTYTPWLSYPASRGMWYVVVGRAHGHGRTQTLTNVMTATTGCLRELTASYHPYNSLPRFITKTNYVNMADQEQHKSVQLACTPPNCQQQVSCKGLNPHGKYRL